jgi:hypothetical protein
VLKEIKLQIPYDTGTIRILHYLIPTFATFAKNAAILLVFKNGSTIWDGRTRFVKALQWLKWLYNGITVLVFETSVWVGETAAK